MITIISQGVNGLDLSEEDMAEAQRSSVQVDHPAFTLSIQITAQSPIDLIGPYPNFKSTC